MTEVVASSSIEVAPARIFIPGPREQPSLDSYLSIIDSYAYVEKTLGAGVAQEVKIADANMLPLFVFAEAIGDGPGPVLVEFGAPAGPSLSLTDHYQFLTGTAIFDLLGGSFASVFVTNPDAEDAALTLIVGYTLAVGLPWSEPFQGWSSL